jgi:hypothetical protein
MPHYDELTVSEKAVAQNTIQLIRAASGSVGKMFNSLRAIQDDANAIAIITSITGSDTAPNQSGLSGADDMTGDELVSIWENLSAMKEAYDTPTNRAAWSKAAGATNLLGNI